MVRNQQERRKCGRFFSIWYHIRYL